MKRLECIRIEAYSIDGEFWVDVVDKVEENTFEAWVYHRDEQEKTLLLRQYKNPEGRLSGIESFIDVVNAALVSEGYVDVEDEDDEIIFGAHLEYHDEDDDCYDDDYEDEYDD